MQDIICRICNHVFGMQPEKVCECKIGLANHVYVVEIRGQKFIIRCNDHADAYKETLYLLNSLAKLKVPVPEIVSDGYFQDCAYLVLTYIHGQDIGEIYATLTSEQKEQIAFHVVEIQKRVAKMEVQSFFGKWEWREFVEELLKTAYERISANRYFPVDKVRRLQSEAEKLDAYFAKISPTAYLDDISTKNLIVSNGQLSGIIDVDSIGIGDNLTFVALTYVSLLNMGYDTEYVKYLLKYMNISREEQKAFLFYALLYCVDFMGERGMTFVGRKVEVNSLVVERLNKIYNELWGKWLKCLEENMEIDNFLMFI